MRAVESRARSARSRARSPGAALVLHGRCYFMIHTADIEMLGCAAVRKRIDSTADTAALVPVVSVLAVPCMACGRRRS